MKAQPATYPNLEDIEMKITVKAFVVVPRDAFELLTNRHATLDEAIQSASDLCAESGMAVMVMELKATAARADRPVKVTKV